ncbi:MAG TPA: T9SS type A sorting domain-containing protein [Chitinophagaceae bacterium]|nr:T9SS type A sorting domain-containing protein [Chitinophagaceae bacterium]
MKIVKLGLLLSFYSFSAKAAVNSLKQTNANWNNTASWTLNRLPQSGDTAVIPSGFTVIVSNNVYNSNYPTLYIRVDGTISFQPNGKLELGANSVVEVLMGGTILSNNTGSERIVIGSVIKYKGSDDGIITGYAIANALSPASGFGPGSGFLTGVLTIKLKNFQSVKINGKVYINWQTDYEKDADYFEVQRAENTTNWKSLHKIKAYNQPNGSNYNYVDTDLIKKDVYFRLKSVQKNGDISYSSISYIKHDDVKAKFFVYPNPTQDYVIVSLNNNLKNGSVQISNFEGGVVQKKSFNNTTGFIKMGLGHLPKGTYILELDETGGIPQSEKIIVR